MTDRAFATVADAAARGGGNRARFVFREGWVGGAAAVWISGSRFTAVASSTYGPGAAVWTVMHRRQCKSVCELPAIQVRAWLTRLARTEASVLAAAITAPAAGSSSRAAAVNE